MNQTDIAADSPLAAADRAIADEVLNKRFFALANRIQDAQANLREAVQSRERAQQSLQHADDAVKGAKARLNHARSALMHAASDGQPDPDTWF